MADQKEQQIKETKRAGVGSLQCQLSLNSWGPFGCSLIFSLSSPISLSITRRRINHQLVNPLVFFQERGLASRQKGPTKKKKRVLIARGWQLDLASCNIDRNSLFIGESLIHLFGLYFKKVTVRWQEDRSHGTERKTPYMSQMKHMCCSPIATINALCVPAELVKNSNLTFHHLSP